VVAEDLVAVVLAVAELLAVADLAVVVKEMLDQTVLAD
jgi:hypothetical protein